MLFSRLHSDHVIAKQFGINISECKNLIKAIDKRHPRVTIILNVASLIMFFAWMIIFGRGTNALEGTQWDIMEFCFNTGFLGILLAIFLGYGIAIFLVTITFLVLRRRFLYKQFSYHLLTPACFWCGYSLKGLDCVISHIVCPECGERSRNDLYPGLEQPEDQ